MPNIHIYSTIGDTLTGSNKKNREMGEDMVERAFSSLGKGFDLTSDFRLKFCKGEERLVVLNETERREVRVPGFGAIRDVSVDIKCDKGDRTRYQSDILTFTQVRKPFSSNT